MTQKIVPGLDVLFGRRDHTTVLHAERKKNTEFNQPLRVLEPTLKF